MRAATDVGGTFTDLVYYEIDPATRNYGPVRTTKTDTTPPDFERGVMNAMRKAGIAPREMRFFAHGSTVVINALTERRGVKTALITTRGFRDVLEIARGNRPDLFNFNARKPKPFVERYLRAELTERTGYQGEIRTPVDLEPLEKMLAFFRAEGVEAIAVCFLHAYRNPENEQRVVQHIRAAWPEVSVLASHEISREWREYERTSTTVLSAYIHPVARRYIESLERKLATDGFTGRPYIMQSNGGIATVDAAKNNPISMIESGPASGIYAAAFLGEAIGEPNLIVLDIGGTTAKCALIEDGEIRITTDYYIERNRKQAGYPIQTPVSEIVEIGNGGGSIAWLDAGGKLHVGPQSAGAVPGPAAYGRGGTKPTTTDANLLLGRIDRDRFVGGEIQPDMAALEASFRPLASAMKISNEALARGIIRIANANMINALRLVSTNKGYDPRDFTLVAFGGGGPMHAIALAEALKIPKVLVPVHSAVFSAWGMLLSDLRRDYVQTRLVDLTPETAPLLAEIFDRMKQHALEEYRRDGVNLAGQRLCFEYHADMRYRRQEHTVKVALPFDNASGRIDLGQAIERFHEAHARRFTYRLDTEVQLVNFHLVAKLPVRKPALARKPATGRPPGESILHTRQVDFDEQGVLEATVYDGLKLDPGHVFEGPAIVQEPSVTLVVPPGNRVVVDPYGNYHVHIGTAGRQAWQ